MKFKLPSNTTEEEFLEIIDKTVSILASKFRFSYHGVEDLRQQGRLFAVEAMAKGKYDESRPLANFLYIHIRNRFINYKRDNYLRNEPPCKSCIFFDPKYKKSKNQCAEFEEKNDCKKFHDWNSGQVTKQNLMRPVDVSLLVDVIEERPSISQIDDLDIKIRNLLAPDLHADYLRMRSEVIIPKGRREKVREAVTEILEVINGQAEEDN